MKTCLVVDDSGVIRRVARRIIEGLGFEVSEAEDGTQALAACEKKLPDAIFFDWDMPGIDGLEFLERLRRLPNGERPKVIVCALVDVFAAFGHPRDAGADDLIRKPFDKALVEARFRDVGLIDK